MRNRPSSLVQKMHNDPSLRHKRLFTLKEAAAYLGRSEWSMRELVWAGTIPVVKTGGSRKIFVDIQDLDAFISQNKSSYH